MHLQKKLLKNLHGGLRGAKLGRYLKYKSCTRSVGLPRRITRCILLPAPQLRIRSLRKIKQIATPKNQLKKLHGELRGATLGLAHKAAPQNQLQLAECSCRKKKLHGGLRCATRGWHLKPQPHHLLRIRSSAKSSKSQLPKNLRGEVRCDMQGWCTKSLLKDRA